MGVLPTRSPNEFAAACTSHPSQSKLEGEVMCPVCGTTLDQSQSPAAEQIKRVIARRIAAGAGVSVQEVNQLLAQFEQTQKMMKMVARGGMQKMLRGMKGMIPGMR